MPPTSPLFPAQVVCQRELGDGGKLLVADTGCGKTLMGLAFIAKRPQGRHLVVAPAQLIPQWKAEQARFYPDLVVEFVHPQYVVKHQDRLFREVFNTVVLDEAHQYANPRTRITTSVLSIAGERRLAMTGTPLCNELADIFPVIVWLGNNQYSHFERSRFLRDLHQLDGTSDFVAFHRILQQTAVYLSKAACNPQLPSLTITVESLPGGRPLSETTPANARRRAWLDSRARDESFHRFVQSTAWDKGVVISASREQSDFYLRELNELGERAAILDGRSSPKRQASLAHTFRETRDIQFLVMGLKCAQGFSFHNCNLMWFGSLGYSISGFWQAVGRIWRVNSQSPVQVTVPYEADSIDEKTFGILASKLAIENQALPPEARSSELISWNFISTNSG